MPTLIAIYDDDPSVQSMLRDLLEFEGFEVVCCGSLLELHQAAVTGAQVAIADTWGPKCQSLEACERDQIQALARLIPTILISGRAWAAHVPAAELGLIALIQKPFDVDELLRHIRPFAAQPGALASDPLASGA